MAWRAANCLLKLQDAFNEHYPNRNKKIGPDAFIGDEAHQGRKSDHNPDSNGVVKAYDISNDPAHGCAVHKIADYMIAHPDPRVRYIISNKRIAGNQGFINGNYPGKTPWKWLPYNGANPHDMHIHVSAEKAAALYDDSRQWDIGPVLPSAVPSSVDTTKMPDFLQRGSLGDDVKVLQWLLRVQCDGDFGINTEAAVKAFQTQNKLESDGVVGHLTWGKIRDLFPLVTTAPTRPPMFTVFNPQIDELGIGQIAANSSIATFNWPGRGKAPIGYTKGVACSFAKAVLSLRSGYGPTTTMAHAVRLAVDHDALTVYESQFAAKGMSNMRDGEDTLRHLFVLLMGLGMRESSGKYTEGRDMSASNTSADSAEAGAWQQSWDSHGGIPQLQGMFDQFKPAGDILLPVYKEGVTSSISQDWGTGAGRDFQHLCKHSPHFAAMACALGMRSLSNHWGPLVRHEASIEPAADAMLKVVQATLG